MSSAHWERLQSHHFPGDHDEHGSVLICGVMESSRERRLLVRDVVLALDGQHYVPGTRGYRALTGAFVSEQIGRCADEKLAYLAVHNHLGGDSVAFSGPDLASHERGYPALLDITEGGPVGALVITERAVAGDIWELRGRAEVSKTVVIGANRRIFYPRRADVPAAVDAMYDRQARLFGSAGQQLLQSSRIGVIGAGGAGSLIGQALYHLGAGEVVVVDDDHAEDSNRPRIVGSRPSDVGRNLLGRAKVAMARRLARATNPNVRFVGLVANVAHPKVAEQLRNVDALFLAADSMQARHVFNALCHQYLIPGFQVGAKAKVDEHGRIEDAFAVSRYVGPGGSCLWCCGLISATRLQDEALSPEVRAGIEYVQGVKEPSVITMNMMSSSFALNDFLFMFTGLHTTNDLGHRRYDFLDRNPVSEVPLPCRASCRECTQRYGQGDRARLPVMLVDGRPRCGIKRALDDLSVRLMRRR
ncbi:MAG: ThiF family adenylyltransferase [Deltaproteobacteria bacterium]|nr:ThiF family adenylyltransferase [Deltaproteobacteria bacterium]